MKLRGVITILALSCAAGLAPASAAPRQRVHARTSPFSGQALPLQRAAANALPSLQAAPVARKAARLCVGSASGCYSTIQAALAASHDGGTIALGRGAFAGGATVTTSVRIVGSGGDATVIKGSGPVLTIGRPGAASWNDVLFFDPPVVLPLYNTVVADNVPQASAGLSRQGGGIFMGLADVLNHSPVARNHPDQCFGC